MIIMASDHRGFLLKEALKNFFNQENIITIDVGSYSKEPVDYPDFARLGMDKVLEQTNNVGIFICGSGIGMSMAANRNPNIRAALCLNTKMAALARKDNDANVLCMPGNLRKKKAIAIVKVFLTTNFEGGRHTRRLKKVSEMAMLYARNACLEEKTKSELLDSNQELKTGPKLETQAKQKEENLKPKEEKAKSEAENFKQKAEVAKTKVEDDKTKIEKTKTNTEKAKTKSVGKTIKNENKGGENK